MCKLLPRLTYGSLLRVENVHRSRDYYFRSRHKTHMARTTKGTAKRGFAAMDKEMQRRIASMGGKASHGGGRTKNSNR